jgi:hypothetical protein
MPLPNITPMSNLLLVGEPPLPDLKEAQRLAREAEDVGSFLLEARAAAEAASDGE